MYPKLTLNFQNNAKIVVYYHNTADDRFVTITSQVTMGAQLALGLRAIVR